MQSDTDSLRKRLEEAEATLNAIRAGKVDALVVSGENGDEIRSIQGMGGLADFVFDHVQQGIFILDGSGRVLRANGRARRLCRGEPEMRMFLDAVDIRPSVQGGADPKEGPSPILPAGWPRTGPRSLSLDVVRKSDVGEDSFFLLEASAIDLKEEGFRGAMIAMTDITARKRADMQLAERNRQILYHLQLTLSITDNTAEALMLTDSLGKVVLHNPAAERLLACTAEDIACLSLNELFRLKSDPSGPAGRTRIPDFTKPRRIENAPALILTREDREIHVEYSLTPVYEGGRWTGAVLMIRDVSVLRKVEEALRASEEKQRHSQKMEAVGRLAGGIAHDFNNLLLAILGFTELSLASLPKQNPVYDNLSEVKKAGERAAALTSQLLAYSRKQVMAPKTVRLGSIVTDMEKLLRRVIGEQIVLTTCIDDQDPWVRVDPGQIQQVLLNLVLNSRDAMPAGGTLSIAVCRKDRSAPGTDGIIPGLLKEGEDSLPPGRFAVIEVRDTGHGMDEHVKARLFEPFFTTKEFGKGSGLGLSTAFGIIKQSSGYVQVFSEPGHGALFRILLPDAEDTEEEWVDEYPAKATAARASETILLVEDEAVVISLLKTVLVRAGYHVLSAASGEEALVLAREFDRGLDLLITDVVMDGMRGPELWELIKPIHPEADVIFISGYSEDHALGNGHPDPDGRRFLSKPFTPQALLEKIRDILEGGIRDRIKVRTGMNPDIYRSPQGGDAGG